MNQNRVRMLQATITWRAINDTDLANCGMEFAAASNDDVIFPRNAVKSLFNHYYREKNELEIMNLARLIDDCMAKDERYCLFYGREFKKILTYLQREGRTARARMLLERCLSSLGVVRGHGLSLCIDGFKSGDYSYSWPVELLATYVKMLIGQGDIELAKRLIRESLGTGDLRDDAVIMLDKILGPIEGRRPSYEFPVISVRKSGLHASYLEQPTIELAALAFLKDELDREGVVAGVDVWRLIPELLRSELPEEAFRGAYTKLAGLLPPDTFYEFLLTNRSLLSDALAASAEASFGAVGYPDLILYDGSGLSDLLLVEVKDVNDRLRPHQEAVLNRFVGVGIPCRLLKFTR